MLPTLLALALSQAPDPEPPAGPVTSAPVITIETADEVQHLRYDQEVYCAQLPPTAAVPSGRYRVQCDDAAHVCLVAPNKVLRDGVETEEELQRLTYCGALPEGRLEALAATHRFVEAVAEAPDGWYRDDAGRIVQVNFDLHRRVYFGGAWAPLFRPGGASDLSRASGLLGRGRADFGIELELAEADVRAVYRLHILEGSAWLGGDELRLMATAIRFDWSASRLSPPLWVTTFIGKPRRFDLDLNLHGWFETLRLELISDKGFLTLASANASLDLWHSKDLQSYLRVRVGPAAELDVQTKSVALRPEGAVEGDFTLDADGFHHLTGAVSFEKLFFEQPIDGRRGNPQRFRARLGYELILLAINDYPLTLVVDARALWRDDLPNVRPQWDFGLDAGLRFSFWAPQRRTAVPVLRRGRG
ncbi:MAG: hypothetical protein JNK82_42280 [Myxococcaceae bacterium]|nr:hypothetical protein [Myxococcaceae bacterium]